MNGFLTRWILCPWQVTVYKFVKSINWSALANLGNSRVSQLTILMPVVGYLVIFNSTLTEWLGTKLPNQVISAPPDFWDAMFDRNLLLLYFGLLIFGLGVGLYNAVVPSQIKRFPSIEDYITAMEGIGTRNLAIGSFDNVVRMYFENVQGEDGIPMFSSQNASFPGDVSGDFHRLIAEMFNALEEGEWWGLKKKKVLVFTTLMVI
ncbi:hypothetical protein ACU4I5_10770 [Ensifer adhaerens]